MSTKTEKRTIAGLEVSCTQFSALRAFALLTRVLQILAPCIEALAPAVKGAKSVGEVDLAAIGPGLGNALSALSDGDSAALLRDLLAGCTVTLPGIGGQLVMVPLASNAEIDAVFTGRLRAMLEVAGFALVVNYRDFFASAGPAAAAPATPTPSA